MDSLCARGKDLLMIPCANPKAGYIAHKDEINASIKRVLESGRYILGEEVEAFEKEFSGYVGVSFGVGVGSGTEAIHLAMKACGLGEGDEVITVSHTAVATAAGIELAGCKAVFVDIEPDYFTLDATKLEAAITSKTKAIVPVHLYGQPVELEPILEIAQRHKLFVIEDCAQAHGAMYKGRLVGSYGDAACFSFYPTKNLGALGDGGMVVTDNAKLAEKAKFLREYGWSKRYVSDIAGWNTRLDELQAAVLRVKLKYLDEDNSKRAKLAKIYGRELAGTDIILPKERKDCRSVYHLYVVRLKRRDELQRFLEKKEIGTAVHYPVGVHLQPAYKCDGKKLSETERVSMEVLSLPMYPELGESEVVFVANAIKEFEKKAG